MSDHVSLYMHVYTGIETAQIGYQNPEENAKIGQTLLDFIYADLSQITPEKGAQNEERLRQIHPYFRHVQQNALQLCLQNSSFQEPGNSFCLQGIALLQEKFKNLLEIYSREGLSDYLIHQISAMHLYEQSRIISCDDIPWVDHFLLGFEDCLNLEFFCLVGRGIRVKSCRNCGQLFLPPKNNIDYCERIFTKEGKTCQEVGYSQTFARTMKNDELLQAYTRAYKAHYARMSKPRKKAANLSREEFEDWYHQAKEKLGLARSGQLDPQEYKDWLKK